MLIFLIIPDLLTGLLRGSTAVGRPDGTLRTSPQTNPTVIKRLRSMGAVSRERLVPLDVAVDAVTSGYLPATAAD